MRHSRKAPDSQSERALNADPRNLSEPILSAKWRSRMSEPILTEDLGWASNADPYHHLDGKRILQMAIPLTQRRLQSWTGSNLHLHEIVPVRHPVTKIWRRARRMNFLDIARPVSTPKEISILDEISLSTCPLNRDFGHLMFWYW
jgi:hypothetical protein